MKNKLTLNEEIEAFLNSDKRELWGAILTNDTDKIFSIVENGEEDILFAIVNELFTSNRSKTLEEKDFALIEEGNSVIVRDLVKLIFSLDINDEREEARAYVGERLFDSIIPRLTEAIKEEAKNYPKNAINPLIWGEGVEVRSALNALIFYYKLKDNTDALHFLIMNRTKVTLAVMSHYKDIVGPDIIESARVKEQMGDTETALSLYRIIESDFLKELSWFHSSPESSPSDEDIIILKSLKEALISIDRLSGSNNYDETCEQIDEVLSRESFEIPNFDDDDDDDE